MVTQLNEHVWQLELRGVNAFLVHGEEVTLVDAGTPWDETRLRSQLTELDLAPTDIDRVLLTHYDLDHVGTLAALAPELDTPVYAGSPDAEFLTGERSPPVRNHKGALQRILGLFVSTPDLEVVTVDDGASVGEFTAHHTPGHTPGHTAFVSQPLEVGLLGDLVREADGQLNPSGWVISYDTTTVHDSVRRLVRTATPFEVAAVGHGESMSDGGYRALTETAERT